MKGNRHHPDRRDKPEECRDRQSCANDLMAIGCFEVLKELGEEIGKTIAGVGYDDQEIAQHLSPTLSPVLLPHHEMGQHCASR
jgi:LacI family transcriptional regulator, galactose operon repressor